MSGAKLTSERHNGRSQRTPKIPEPSRVVLLYRTVVWLFAFARLLFWLRVNRHRKHARAVRVRRTVEKMGGPAILLLRQFAMRLELFPLDIATELSRLEDSAPPMPFATALREFKKHLHRDVEDVFEVFDPATILSTNMDCVYQAILRSGDKVAVRIMRPKAPQRIHTERLALTRFIKVLAWMFPSYEDRLVALKDELPFIEKEIIDFVSIARFHRVLEKEIKRQKLKKKFHVAKVYFDYCSTNVIVSEFIEGYWLHDVLGAQELADKEALARLAKRNIDPKKCGWRAFEFGLWSMLENTFSLSAPRASQFGVMPDNKIVLVQIGTVGTFGRYHKRVYSTIFTRLLQRDFEGMAELLIQSLFPLPPMDVYRFTKAIEQRIVTQLIAIENKKSPQWVRSGAGLWVGFLEEVQSHGVFIPAELSRALQSICVFSDIAFRLDPKTNLRRRLRRYMRCSYRRGARETVRYFRNPEKRGGSSFTSRPQGLLNTIARAQLSMEAAVEKAPIAYVAASKKSGHALSQFLETVLLLSKITAIWLAIQVGLHWREYGEVNLLTELHSVVTYPAFLVLIALFFAIMARRIQFRLDDLDPNEE